MDVVADACVWQKKEKKKLKKEKKKSSKLTFKTVDKV